IIASRYLILLVLSCVILGGSNCWAASFCFRVLDPINLTIYFINNRIMCNTLRPADTLDVVTTSSGRVLLFHRDMCLQSQNSRLSFSPCNERDPNQLWIRQNYSSGRSYQDSSRTSCLTSLIAGSRAYLSVDQCNPQDQRQLWIGP